jgi:2-oxoglutarate ferredoxin oxidoreductase subunit gamma
MNERILIAGSGGQGILFIGKLLAQAAIKSAPYITYFPAYGAEVRGGTCSCQVILSSEEIGSPLAESFSSMIIMNQPSAERFLDKLEDDGIAVLNRSLCAYRKDSRLVFVQAEKIAEEVGSLQSANLVMLGALLAAKPFIPLDAIEKQISVISSGRKEALRQININALNSGASSAKIKE